MVYGVNRKTDNSKKQTGRPVIVRFVRAIQVGRPPSVNGSNPGVIRITPTVILSSTFPAFPVVICCKTVHELYNSFLFRLFYRDFISRVCRFFQRRFRTRTLCNRDELLVHSPSANGKTKSSLKDVSCERIYQGCENRKISAVVGHGSGRRLTRRADPLLHGSLFRGAWLETFYCSAD